MSKPAEVFLLLVMMVGMSGCSSHHGGVTQETFSSVPSGSASSGSASSGSAAASASSSGSSVPSAAQANGGVETPMVALPAGTFVQGAAGATGDVMGWPHTESVGAFSIDVTEVTVGAYARCVAAGTCQITARGALCNAERGHTYDDDPMNCVTWDEAARYCAFRGSVLPTEAMWEFAAGGRHAADWPWTPKGGSYDQTDAEHFVAKYGVCKDGVPSDAGHLPDRKLAGRNTTCPVGSLPRGDTLEGVKDMEGNVAEWTSSIYCKLPSRDCDANKRVVKGSAYDDIGGAWMGIRQRLAWIPSRWDPQIGFRCARPTRR